MPVTLRRWLGSALVLLMVLLGVGVAFPQTANDVKVELFYDSVWNDITTDVLIRDGISITRGRANEGYRCDPGRAALSINNRTGKYSPRNPASPLYGKIGRNTQLRISVTDNAVTYVRFVGEVTAWPSRWDVSQNDIWVPIEANGILRRLGQGASPLRSAMFRTSSSAINGVLPHAYWALEDLAAPSGFAWSLGTPGAPMEIQRNSVTATAAGTSTMRGSAPVANIVNGDLFGGLIGTVPSYASTTKWVVQGAFDITNEGAFLNVITASPSGPEIEIYLDPNAGFDSVELRVRGSVGGNVINTGTGSLDSAKALGDWISITLMSEADSSGSTDRLTVNVRNSAAALLGTATTLFGTDTHAQVKAIQAFDFHFGSSGGSVGHIVLRPDTAFTLGTDDLPHAQAMHGREGEQAHTRIDRLCDEEGISIVLTGSSSAPMGAQRIATLLENLEDCANTDRGFLFEQRPAVGLAYRTNASRYSQ